jgi:protein O-GlcNAc transferase
MTLDELFAAAMTETRAGHHDRAEAIYREILSTEPDNPKALFNLGNALRRAHRITDAIAVYQQAIKSLPDFPEAINNLALLFNQQGQPDRAISLFRQAIALRPDNADAHYSLGILLANAGQFPGAVLALRQAISLRHNWPEAHAHLGMALARLADHDATIAACNDALALKPDLLIAWTTLANSLAATDRLEPAIRAWQKAVTLDPASADAHAHLGIVLWRAQKFPEAATAFRSAITLRPNDPQALHSLSCVLRALSQLDQAAVAANPAIALNPNYAEAHGALGEALLSLGQRDAAIQSLRRAIALQPDQPDALGNLGAALCDLGQAGKSLQYHRRAAELCPDDAAPHSAVLFTMLLADNDPNAQLAEHRRWSDRHAAPFAHAIRPHDNDRSPTRRLRIGYVSANLCRHVVGWNLLPLLANHNRNQFEIFCYASLRQYDEISQHLRANADAWRDIAQLDDAKTAEMIRADRIDILVELGLHTGYTRLLVLARKPAPVQVTFMGYPGTTGLATVDYRLTDPYLDPPGQHDDWYTEQSIRLPHTFWCYAPPQADPPVAPLPARNAGHLTFGFLGNFYKVNEPTLDRWAKVLSAVPKSRFLLSAPPDSSRPRVLQHFARQGITSDRIQFADRQIRHNYLQIYDRIDIALDTLPYNGHTTSLDAFWMGVPTITRIGATVVGRAGYSELCNLNLPELAADTDEQFVQIAAALAADLPRLTELRAALRQRMTQSPLMDASKFARDIEAAYRKMWHRWTQ